MSYVGVVNRLTDLKSLALLPEKGEQSAMWSSYDRRSRYDASTGKYLEWYANGDGANQQIRMEGKDAVLAEMEGPGAIVRIWSARPDTGHIKVYLDGSDEPVIDLPFIQFFDCTAPPFKYEGLVYKAARGCNNYIPITYNQSCKIVANPGWGVYYHFNYISFKEGTRVERFSMDLSEEAIHSLGEVNDFFIHRIGQTPYQNNTADSIILKKIQIEPGSTANLARIQGEYAIKSFKIFPSFIDREDEMTGLRKLVLTMYWDGQNNPSGRS